MVRNLLHSALPFPRPRDIPSVKKAFPFPSNVTISKRKKETATYITIIQIFVSKASIRSTRKELRNRWTRDFGMVACERGISCFSCRRAKKEEKRGKSEGRRSGDRFCGPCQVPAPRGKWQRKIFSGSVSSRGGSRDLGSRVERSNNDSPIRYRNS